MKSTITALVFGACLAVLATIMLVNRQPKSVLPTQQGPSLMTLTGQKYKDQLVPLDGNHYVDCTFENVTFRWHGHPYMIDRGHFTGAVKIEAHDSVADTIEFLKTFGFLEPSFAASWHRN